MVVYSCTLIEIILLPFSFVIKWAKFIWGPISRLILETNTLRSFKEYDIYPLVGIQHENNIDSIHVLIQHHVVDSMFVCFFQHFVPGGTLPYLFSYRTECFPSKTSQKKSRSILQDGSRLS